MRDTQSDTQFLFLYVSKVIQRLHFNGVFALSCEYLEHVLSR
jgi:hypothetical protein